MKTTANKQLPLYEGSDAPDLIKGYNAAMEILDAEGSGGGGGDIGDLHWYIETFDLTDERERKVAAFRGGGTYQAIIVPIDSKYQWSGDAPIQWKFVAYIKEDGEYMKLDYYDVETNKTKQFETYEPLQGSRNLQYMNDYTKCGPASVQASITEVDRIELIYLAKKRIPNLKIEFANPTYS